MTPSEFTTRFNAELVRRFGITADDAGVRPELIAQWTTEDTPPEQCAVEYGEKYDLTDCTRDPWMKDIAALNAKQADAILKAANITKEQS